MPEYHVPYTEQDDWKPPKGETVVADGPDQNGAWLFVTEKKSAKSAD